MKFDKTVSNDFRDWRCEEASGHHMLRIVELRKKLMGRGVLRGVLM